LGIAACVIMLVLILTLLYFTHLHMIEALGSDTDTHTAVFALIALRALAGYPLIVCGEQAGDLSRLLHPLEDCCGPILI